VALTCLISTRRFRVEVVEARRGRKTRKYGRNRAKCHAYRLAGRREANKMRRIVRDARRAGDSRAVSVYEAYRGAFAAAIERG
jgi:hypothetical protein